MLLVVPPGSPVLLEIGRVELGLRGAHKREASADFRVCERSAIRPVLRLNLSVDVDADLARDARAVRLRAARGGVQIAKRLAEAIGASQTAPVCDTRNWGTDSDGANYAWWEIAWLISEPGPDGLGRRAKAVLERRTESVRLKPSITAELSTRARVLAEHGSRYLHGAISAAANRAVFSLG